MCHKNSKEYFSRSKKKKRDSVENIWVINTLPVVGSLLRLAAIFKRLFVVSSANTNIPVYMAVRLTLQGNVKNPAETDLTFYTCTVKDFKIQCEKHLI